MKYKVGDKVRIKYDISGCRSVSLGGDMDVWQGKVMTIRRIFDNGCYKMHEDIDEFNGNETAGWNWYEDMIEGPAEPELTNVEVLKLAIDTYGEDEQIRVCQEEMNELGVAFSKYHRRPSEETRRNVQEEIADVCVMMQQAKMMFGEKDVDKIALQKIQRLKERLEDEREVEVEIVYGKYSVNCDTSTWANINGLPVKIGYIAIAEDERGCGSVPIIVTHMAIEKVKAGELKDFKTIVEGCAK